MKQFSILAGLILTTLTLVAADKPAHADKVAQAEKSAHAKKPPHARARPFIASGSGVVAGDIYASDFEATHLGQSSLWIGVSPPVDFLLTLFPYSATITSASGDELDFEFDAQLYQLDYQEDEAIWVVNATVTFTGGTGRFEDATGSADMTIHFAADLYSFDFLIDGTINY